MGWKAVVMGLALALVTAVGCKQQCFLTEPDYNEFHQALGLPPNLANDPGVGVSPLIHPVGEPVTIDRPDREPWHLTLNEAIAVALEQGTVGIESIRFGVPASFALSPGALRVTVEDLVTFTGQGVAGSDKIGRASCRERVWIWVCEVAL